MMLTVVLPLAACGGSEQAVPTRATPSTSETAEDGGCTKFKALKAVFPEASAVGFSARAPVRRAPRRAPVWPGRCGGWWTTYDGSEGVDITVTLYKTHEQALVALAEPAFGPVEKLGNGALARTFRAGASVDGAPKQSTGFASVYRNVFSSSLSIADEPISLAAHERLHRRIDAGLLALG
jgi:hypothetical protein